MNTTRVAWACGAILLTAAAAILILAAAVRLQTPIPVAGPVADGSWIARSRAWFTPRGFSGAETDLRSNRHFSWMGAHADIIVRNIDRARSYRVILRIAAGRGPGLPPPPHLVATVDGVPRLRTETTNETNDYVIEVPPATRDTINVGIDVSNTFVPGANDPRALGVMVDGVALEPVNASFRPTWSVIGWTSFAAALYALVAAFSGARPAVVLIVGMAAACAHAWLLALDAAFVGRFAERLAHIAIGAGIVGAGIGWARHQWPSRTAPEWPLAAGLVLVLGSLKLAFFAHASATIGDSIFQVHRAQYVAAGNYFFTSVTPRPFFEFPYAIALYVHAMPFWSWFPGELDRVLLLRGLSIAADSLVGFAMYVAFRVAWQQPWPAILFAVLWPFARAPFSALCTSNLTNLYGQGIFGVAMGLVGVMATSPSRSPLGWLAITGLLSVAFLSHFSTVSVGVPLVGLVGVLLVAGASGPVRRVGVGLLISLTLAVAVSYVVYYSHFHEVYRTTIDRVAAREGEAETRSMVAPVSVKAERWRQEVVGAFGIGVLATAALGAVWLLVRRRREGLTLVLAGWGLAWIIFSTLGVFTAIEMRSNLAAAPLLLGLGTFALGSLAAASRLGAAVAVALAAIIAWGGLTLWAACLVS
jgi:hypothetical protein